jgi:hypothetical protein
MRRFGWLCERGVLAGSSARLLPLEDVHRVSCSARILGASLRDRSGHFEELGAHARMRLLVAFGADEMFETLDRSKHEPCVGVSIPSGILLEEPPAARTLHHRGANGVVIAFLRRKTRNCGQGERFFRHGVRVY